MLLYDLRRYRSSLRLYRQALPLTAHRLPHPSRVPDQDRIRTGDSTLLSSSSRVCRPFRRARGRRRASASAWAVAGFRLCLRRYRARCTRRIAGRTRGTRVGRGRMGRDRIRLLRYTRHPLCLPRLVPLQPQPQLTRPSPAHGRRTTHRTARRSPSSPCKLPSPSRRD
jgi:hypothetical protein